VGLAATVALLVGLLGVSGHASDRPVAGAQPEAAPIQPRPQSGRGGSSMNWEWWNDADVQKALGLSPEKIKRIDDIFEKRSRDLQPMAEEFRRQFAELDDMTKSATVDEATYGIQVLRVESLGARLRESRTMMLYRIFRELQPDQYKKLQDILAHRGPARNSGAGAQGGNSGNTK
jgi:Spy/CpxP family protein refolding chaperone